MFPIKRVLTVNWAQSESQKRNGIEIKSRWIIVFFLVFGRLFYILFLEICCCCVFVYDIRFFIDTSVFQLNIGGFFCSLCECIFFLFLCVVVAFLELDSCIICFASSLNIIVFLYLSLFPLDSHSVSHLSFSLLLLLLFVFLFNLCMCDFHSLHFLILFICLI